MKKKRKRVAAAAIAVKMSCRQNRAKKSEVKPLQVETENRIKENINSHKFSSRTRRTYL